MRAVRLCLGLGMALAVSACQVTLPTIGSGARKAPQTLSLAQSGLQVTAPEGYCFDPKSATQADAAHFVALASCGSLRGKKPEDGKTLLVTLTFTQPLEAAQGITPETLDAYFHSLNGRSMLARSGDANDVQVLSSEIAEDEIFTLHASDVSPEQVSGVASDYWRAITVVQGRLLSVSASQFDMTSQPAPAARALVMQLARDVRAQNASLASETTPQTGL